MLCSLVLVSFLSVGSLLAIVAQVTWLKHVVCIDEYGIAPHECRRAPVLAQTHTTSEFHEVNVALSVCVCVCVCLYSLSSAVVRILYFLISAVAHNYLLVRLCSLLFFIVLRVVPLVDLVTTPDE